MTEKQLQLALSLSKLRLTAEESSALMPDLVRMQADAESLKSLDDGGAAPAIWPFAPQSVLREDVAEPQYDTEKLISASPSREGTAYLVPKVLE